MKHLISSLLSICTITAASAQSADYDTYGRVQLTPTDTIPSAEMELSTDNEKSAHIYSIPFVYSPYLLPKPDATDSRRTDDIDISLPPYSSMPGHAVLASWTTGMAVASGEQYVMPGLMRIDTGSIGIYQTVGRLGIYAGAEANKYGFFRGLHTQYGVTANINYQISSNVSVTAFGTYYFGDAPVLPFGLPMSPGMAGYYNTSRFGGYVDYRITSNFGIMAGAQAAQNIGTNQYRFEPIATPYVKIGKVAIGLPVGQMIHSAIQSRRSRRR